MSVCLVLMEFMAYVLKFTVGINTFIHLLSREAALLYFDSPLFYEVFVFLHFEPTSKVASPITVAAF